MSMAWVRKYYRVPAKRGMRVRFTGGKSSPELGTITSASNGRLNIRLDGLNHSRQFHPTWKLEYLTGDAR